MLCLSLALPRSVPRQSFEDTVKQGIDRANQTLRHVKSAWVKEQQVNLDDGKIVNYQGNLAITFLLEDGAQTTSGQWSLTADVRGQRGPIGESAWHLAQGRFSDTS